MRFLKSYGLAFLIVAGIAIWMLSGTFIQGGRGPGQGEQPLVDVIDGEGAPLRGALESAGVVTPISESDEDAESAALAAAETERLVRVSPFIAQDLPLIVQLRGRTEANAVVAARAETNGIVKSVHVTKGQSVAAGDLLCTLDQGTRQARLSTALAQLEQAKADLENNIALRERGVAPANTARAFEIALLAAQASYDEALAEFERTEIRAEVAGVVQDPLTVLGASLAPGAECATIVQLDPMLFIGEVAEARVSQLKPGEQAQVTTVTGQQVFGEVQFVASTANASTRTFRVEITIPNADGAILDGVTADALIHVGTIKAHLLPQSVLTLETDGTLGIRSVDGTLVEFHEIEIVRDTREGIWVTGLPDTIDIITIGQEYVQAGQTVRVSVAGDSQS